MDNKITIGAIVVIILLAVGGFFLLQNQGQDTATQQPTDSMEMEEPMAGEEEAMEKDAMMKEEKEAMMEEDTQDIVDTAIAAGTFNTLAEALTAAELVDTLKTDGPFTVFAPTDEAFEALPEGTLDELLANPDQLEAVLLYHVVDRKVMAEDVVTLDSATTLNGQDVTITVTDGGDVQINDATVTTTDIKTSNGVIHVIDTVLVPADDHSQ